MLVFSIKQIYDFRQELVNLLQLLWATLSNLYATGWCTFILSEIFLFLKLSICSYKQGLKDAPTPQILFVADRFCPMVNSFLKFGACCNAVGSAPPETNNCCRSFSSFSSATQTFLVNRRQDPLTPVEDFDFGKKGDWVKETQAQPIFFYRTQVRSLHYASIPIEKLL